MVVAVAVATVVKLYEAGTDALRRDIKVMRFRIRVIG